MIGRIICDVGEVFRERFARDGEAIPAQQAFVEQALHQRGEAANPHQIDHQEATAGAQVSQHGRALGDAEKVIQPKLNVRGVRHRQQMQHCVGRASERHHHRDRVLKRLARHDVAWADVLCHEAHHRFACRHTILGFFRRNRCHRRAVGQAHAHGFNRGGHGVRGVHPTTGACAWDGLGLDLFELGVINLAGGSLPNGFKNRHDVGVFARNRARHDGSAIDKHRWAVQPREADHAARHVFIAATNRHDAVVRLTPHDRLNRVGDHFPGDQRILHAFGAHGDAVGDRDCVELHRLSASALHSPRRVIRELVDVHVARRNHSPCGSDANLGLLEVGFLKAHAVEHTSAGSAFDAFGDLRGIFAVSGLSGFCHGETYV